jgi:hypothetical protein
MNDFTFRRIKDETGWRRRSRRRRRRRRIDESKTRRK